MVHAVLIGQPKQYNARVERIIKFVDAVYGLCAVAVRVYKWDGLRHLNWQ